MAEGFLIDEAFLRSLRRRQVPQEALDVLRRAGVSSPALVASVGIRLLRAVDGLSSTSAKTIFEAATHAHEPHEHDGRRRAAVFWDFQNCAPPRGVAILQCVTRIREATLGSLDVIHEFKAYLDCGSVPPKQRKQLDLAHVEICDVPSGKPGAADLKMIDGAFKFALAHSSGTVVLVTGDSDFVNTARSLTQRGFDVIVMHNRQAKVELREAGARSLSFEEIVTESSCDEVHAETCVAVSSIVAEDDSSYQCFECQRQFGSAFSLAQHCRDTGHRESDCDADLRCYFCREQFYSQESRALHVDADHCTEENFGRLFTQYGGLGRSFSADHLLKKFARLGIFPQPPSDADLRMRFLMNAFHFGLLRLAKFLLVDPRQLNSFSHSCCEIEYDEWPYTPLNMAAFSGHLEMVKLALSFDVLDPNLGASSGKTPLHYAIWMGRLEVIRLLLGDRRVDVNRFNLSDELRRVYERRQRGLVVDARTVLTPLMYAVRWGKHDSIPILLNSSRVDVNFVNPWGVSALSVAVVEACKSMRSTMYEEERETIQPEALRTLLLLLDHPKLEVFDAIIVEDSVRLSSRQPELELPRCFTRHRIAQLGEKPLSDTRHLQEYLTLTRGKWTTLGSYGDGGPTPVGVYALSCGSPIAHLLLSHDSYIVSPCDSWGRGPLFYAVQVQDTLSVSLLLAKGANVNACDVVGISVLLMAAVQQNEEMVQMLLRNGALLDVQQTRKCVSYCRQKGHDKVARIARATFVAVNSVDSIRVLDEAQDDSCCIS